MAGGLGRIGCFRLGLSLVKTLRHFKIYTFSRANIESLLVISPCQLFRYV